MWYNCREFLLFVSLETIYVFLPLYLVITLQNIKQISVSLNYLDTNMLFSNLWIPIWLYPHCGIIYGLITVGRVSRHPLRYIFTILEADLFRFKSASWLFLVFDCWWFLWSECSRFLFSMISRRFLHFYIFALFTKLLRRRNICQVW